MKIWVVEAQDANSGAIQLYCSSKKIAEQVAKDLLDNDIDSDPVIGMRLLPTDKKGLIRFLNRNAVTQDGFIDCYIPESVR